MSNLFQLESVKYICSCGSLKPICNIYFCRHCLRFRCTYCISHEVDSHYCGNCSENMPSAEAKQRKNRCGTCYDCPSCNHTLTVRANTVQVPSEDDPQTFVATKLHYLSCGFCRWTTRDSGLPDSKNQTGPWQEPESEASKQFVDILDYFRMLAIREKNSKEKKLVPKNKYLAAGRHGLTHLLPKRYPATTPEEMGKSIPPPKFLASTETEIDELSDEYFQELLDISKVTALSQRLHQLETQPDQIKELLPTHKQLLVKRSLRCRVCERNISKPEYSPVSIKFKIQSNGYYHVPQVRLANPLPQPLLPGQSTRVLIKISNPIQFPTSIKFMDMSFVPLNKEELIKQVGGVDCINKIKDPARESSTDVSLPSEISTPSNSITFIPAATAECGGGDATTSQLLKEVHVLPISNDKLFYNCRLQKLPEADLVLPPRDETSDFDDFADTPDFNDDPQFVPWRKANKASVYLDVVRDEDSEENDDCVLGFSIEYDYVNTIVALESKMSQGPQKVRLKSHILLQLK